MPVFVIVVGFSFFSVDFFLIYVALSAVILEPALPFVGLAFVFGMTAIGAIAYINSFSEAISSRSWLWALDHLLAPLFGALLTIWVMLPFYIHQLIPTMQTLAHRQSFLDLGVGFCVSILWWVFAFGGPVLAVMGMNSDDWVRRRSSYVGFFLTAATWGVLLAIAIRPPHG